MSFIEATKEKIIRFWDEEVMGNSPNDDYEPALVKASRDYLKAHGFHNILKYDEFDPDRGLFYNDDSVGFCLEVEPQTGDDGSVSQRLLGLFGIIPPGYGVQWMMFGSPGNDRIFDSYLDIRRIAVDADKADPFYLQMAEERVKYLRKGCGLNLFPNRSFMLRNFRVLFSIVREGSSDDAKLISELQRLQKQVVSVLNAARLPAAVMDAEALKDFLWLLLNPQEMFTNQPKARNAYDEGRSLKNQLVRIGQPVRVKHDQLIFGVHDEESGSQEISLRSYNVFGYPRKKELWQMANIVGSVTDDTLQYPCPFLITQGVFTHDPHTSTQRAQLEAINARKNAKSKMAEHQPELAEIDRDWQAAQAQLEQGASFCDHYINVTLFAPKADLIQHEQVLTNIWKAEGFELYQCDCFPLVALVSSLPMTLTAKTNADVKLFRMSSRKTSLNAVDMTPVLAEWRGQGPPILMFFGRRGSPTRLDFYANNRNYNFFVAGVSGTGKTVLINEIINSYRSIGARVWIIDVGYGYKSLVKASRGTFLEFAPNLNLCVNPFTWVGSDPENTFEEEMALLKPTLARMASPRAPLSQFQSALLEQAITAVWAEYGNDADVTKVAAYLKSKIKNENGRPERQAFELGTQLYSFTKDGQYGHFFNGKANLRLDGDLIGLELEQLKNVPDLRAVVLGTLTSRIALEMYQTGRNTPKLCVLDEAWQLLGDDEETAKFIEEGYRRARKYRGIFGLGTQGIADAYANPAARAAYDNAATKIYTSQDPKTLEKLISDGFLPDGEALKRALNSLDKNEHYSEFLWSTAQAETILRHVPDPLSLLMASSAAEDFEAIVALERQGVPTFAALRRVLEIKQELAHA